MHFKLKRCALVCATIVAASFSFQSYAGTATSNMTVTASIAANCTISTATVAFGAYDPIVTNAAVALTGTGSVTTTCTNGSAVTVTLGQGANALAGSTATVPQRQMASAANRLGYFLYSDAARTVVWGDTAPTGKADTGTGAASILTVYGTVTAGQNKPTGSYSDTVVATVTF